jgi:hypothetical protein
MSADQIAEIAPLVREVFASEPSSPDVQLCATLEVVGHPDVWLQIVPGTLNFSYPLATDPATTLGRLLANLPESSVVSWAPDTFATVTFGPVAPRTVAAVIDALLSTLFSLDDYAIDGSIEEIPA